MPCRGSRWSRRGTEIWPSVMPSEGLMMVMVMVMVMVVVKEGHGDMAVSNAIGRFDDGDICGIYYFFLK